MDRSSVDEDWEYEEVTLMKHQDINELIRYRQKHGWQVLSTGELAGGFRTVQFKRSRVLRK